MGGVHSHDSILSQDDVNAATLADLLLGGDENLGNEDYNLKNVSEAGTVAAGRVLHQNAQAYVASSFVQLRLSPIDAANVRGEIEAMGPVDYDADIDSFEELAAAALQRTLEPLLEQMRQQRDAAAAMWIRGFDFGPVHPTAKERCSHKTHIPAAVAAGLARVLGCGLVGYTQEKIYTHPLFHDIRPVRDGKEGSNGAGEPLNFHMDMSYVFTKAPEWLMLVCLREGVDPHVKTPVAHNREAFLRLAEAYPEDIAVLKEPTNFRILQPDSAGGGFVDEMPLLTGDNADEAIFWLRVHHDRIVPQNEHAARAFSHLQHVLDEIADNSVHLVAGDLLLVNNMKALHKRTEFKAAFSGEDRLLVRSYLQARSMLPEGRMW